jgi:hypothetical protein
MSCDSNSNKVAKSAGRGTGISRTASLSTAARAADGQPPRLQKARLYRGSRAFTSASSAARAHCLTPGPEADDARDGCGRQVSFEAVFDKGVFCAELLFYEDGSVEMANARSHPEGAGLGRAGLAELWSQLREAEYDPPIVLSAVDEAQGFWDKMAEEGLVG